MRDDLPSLELELPAVRESASRARRAVRDVAQGLVVDLYAVELAVAEAVANVIVHAYRDRRDGDDRDRHDRAGAMVRVTVAVERDHVRVDVADDGVGMSPRPDSPGLGLGLGLIAGAADELDIEQHAVGTRLVMRFRRTHAT